MPEHFVRRVAEILTRYSMLRPGGRVGVAVSGGADSTVLLYALHRLRAEFGITLTVLHVNHELRGDESDADESFVRALSHSLGYPIVVARLPPGQGNLEEEARNRRGQFFADAMKVHELDRVALGHTRSDQAETVLFRLLRGTGMSGLAAMRYTSPSGFIRPLLEFSRQEVRTWAHSEDIHWREDSTNTDLAFARNRLRLATMPALAVDYNPNLEATLAQMARLAQDEEDYWAELCKTLPSNLFTKARLGIEIDVQQLEKLHVAARRRVLRFFISTLKGDLRGLDGKHIEAILDLCGSTAGHNRVLVPGVDALRSFHKLLLSRPGTLSGEERNYEVAISIPGVAELPFGMGTVSLSRAPANPSFCVTVKETQHFAVETVLLDEDALLKGCSGSLAVRNWQPGDEIRQPGHQKHEKLKSLFQENRILLWHRRHWPVLRAGDTIAWVRQFGCAAEIQGHSNSRSLLKLTYRPAEG